MDYKDTWNSIGKFFYTAHFSLVVSIILVWDSSVLELFPHIFRISEWNNAVNTLFVLISVAVLIFYFIIDWLDANIVTEIDDNVELKDIVCWLLAPLFLSSTIVILVKKIPNSENCNWLCGGFMFYLLYNIYILFKRDRLINISKPQEEENSKRKRKRFLVDYDGEGLCLILAFVVIFLLVFLKHIIFCGTIVGENWFCTLILSFFMLAIIVNCILKYHRYRHKHLNVLSNKKDTGKTS